MKNLFNKYICELTLFCNTLFLFVLFIVLYQWFCKAQMPDMIAMGFLFTVLFLNTLALILDSLIKIRDKKQSRYYIE